MTRDPRSDPQPGDELRIDNVIRRMIRRKGDMLWIDGEALSHARGQLAGALREEWGASCAGRETGRLTIAGAPRRLTSS